MYLYTNKLNIKMAEEKKSDECKQKVDNLIQAVNQLSEAVYMLKREIRCPESLTPRPPSPLSYDEEGKRGDVGPSLYIDKGRFEVRRDAIDDIENDVEGGVISDDIEEMRNAADRDTDNKASDDKWEQVGQSRFYKNAGNWRSDDEDDDDDDNDYGMREAAGDNRLQIFRTLRF